MANDRIGKYMRVTAEFTIRPAPGTEKTYYPDDTIQVIGADFIANTVEFEVGAARRCHCMPLGEFLAATVPTRF